MYTLFYKIKVYKNVEPEIVSKIKNIFLRKLVMFLIWRSNIKKVFEAQPDFTGTYKKTVYIKV